MPPFPVEDERAIGRYFVVDESSRILDSGTSELAVGAELTASSWLGAAALDAIGAARRGSGAAERVGTDWTHGTRWIVRATVGDETNGPARVVAIDVTAAVLAERAAFFPKLVHSMQNMSFALHSILDAIDLDRPTGAQLGEHVAHMRDPAARVAAIMTRLAASIAPLRPSLARVALDAVVARTLSRSAPERRPKKVSLREAELAVLGDVELLADALSAMIETGDEAAAALTLDRVDVGGRVCGRLVVEHASLQTEAHPPAAIWDLAYGPGLEVSLRLNAARAIVVAHGGDVLAERAKAGRLRLGARIPLISAA